MLLLCTSACDCGIKAERAATLIHNKRNAWTQMGDRVAVHCQIVYRSKNKTLKVRSDRTQQSSSPVQQSSVRFTRGQTWQALRAQTITIPKRLIPSVDQSYWFPSKNPENKKKKNISADIDPALAQPPYPPLPSSPNISLHFDRCQQTSWCQIWNCCVYQIFFFFFGEKEQQK